MKYLIVMLLALSSCFAQNCPAKVESSDLVAPQTGYYAVLWPTSRSGDHWTFSIEGFVRPQDITAVYEVKLTCRYQTARKVPVKDLARSGSMKMKASIDYIALLVYYKPRHPIKPNPIHIRALEP